MKISTPNATFRFQLSNNIQTKTQPNTNLNNIDSIAIGLLTLIIDILANFNNIATSIHENSDEFLKLVSKNLGDSYIY